MKKLLITAIFAGMLFTVTAQEKYSRVKIYADHQALTSLAGRGLVIDHCVFKAGTYVICEIDEDDMAIVEASGLTYEVMIGDVSKFYRERNEPYLSQLDEVKRMEYFLSREWPVPAGFELGTCGGFLTIDQCMEHLDSMASQYPDLISARSALDFETHNGRNLYWVRLSDNPGIDEDEPEVLYTGMHHAREPIGMQLLIYYMYYLLENYDTDPDVRYIVDNFELYFVPIINPDGYAFNIQNNPNGGGMWRKNRRVNDDGSHGVDLNRNYSYMWGYDNYGSSPEPGADTYRGPSEFSEPETQCLRNFCLEHEFKLALNYHSYGNQLLYPWGYTQEPNPEDQIFNFYAQQLTYENAYEYGASSLISYPTNGSSDDWFYGEQEEKEPVFAYTPEIGDGTAGFWPPIPQIIPLCQYNMYQNILLARLAGPWAEIKDQSPTILSNKSGLLFFELTRMGQLDSANYIISLVPLSNSIISVNEPIVFSDLDIEETRIGAFIYELSEDIQDGERVKFLLTLDDGFGIISDTLTKVFGSPLILFADSVNSSQNWICDKWDTTSSDYHSPELSITDSPSGQYGNFENNAITLSSFIDLSDYNFGILNFWSKWDIETGKDYVQVLISTENDTSWIPVKGKYSRPGTLSQAPWEPVYHGSNHTWIFEEIDLNEFTGNKIKIRLILKSDNFVVADGFFWDDMTVTVIDLATGIDVDNIPGPPVTNISIQPNPVSGKVTMKYALDRFHPGLNNLTVFDIKGQKVYEALLAHGADLISWDVSSWPSGMYFYSISYDQSVIASGKIIVK
jgi:hypothetical protein